MGDQTHAMDVTAASGAGAASDKDAQLRTGTTPAPAADAAPKPDGLDAAFSLGNPTQTDTPDDALSDDDAGDLPVPIRRALTVLLKQAYVCELDQPRDFATIAANRGEISRALANLGLALKLSERYGCAWAVQAGMAGKSPLLALKTPAPLTRDPSILLISLRVQQHALETRGEENWFVDREDLEGMLKAGPYADDRDGARVTKAVRLAIERLCSLGYLKPVAGVEDRYRIMPILPAVFGLDRARELLSAFGVPEGDKDDPADPAAGDKGFSPAPPDGPDNPRPEEA